MAAMKLYYGENLVGGEVDLDEFEQLKTDVAGKYDKGDPIDLDGGAMEYTNAALMEAAVKGNKTEIGKLQDNWEQLLLALDGFDGSQLEVELEGYFQKYADDDDDQTSLMYDSAAKMGIAVARNIQDIEANKTAITAGDDATLTEAKDHADAQDVINLQSAKTYADTKDAETLAAANQHSDANDTVTLDASKTYTDEKVAAIPGVDGLEEFEKTVEELDQNAVRNANSAAGVGNPGEFLGGVIQIATVGALPTPADPNTLYIVKA